MFNLKYLIIASVQATKNKSDLDNIIKSLPGRWDIINLDGKLISVSNKPNHSGVCGKNITRLAYVKALKDCEKDNRTYLQVDSMEVYVKYHILKNPNLYIADANNFSEMEMNFDIDNLVHELGVNKKNILYKVSL